MDLYLSPSLSIPNIFDPKDYKELATFALLSRGTVILTRPSYHQLEEFCASRQHRLIMTASAEQTYMRMKMVQIGELYDHQFTAVFYGTFEPSITRDRCWQKITSKTTNKQRWEYKIAHLYEVFLLDRLLRDYGYVPTYNDSINWISNVRQGNPIEKIDQHVILKPHQIDTVEKFFGMDGTCAIIADDPGLGKTISAGMILKRLFDSGKIKRGIWVVPTHPLAQQIATELKRHFDLDAGIICADTVDKKLRHAAESVYLKYGLCILTWGTFTSDWGKKYFGYVRDLPFDFGVFDEVHRVKYGQASYNAMMNFRGAYRIGLTGTPCPNGRWKELYSLVYSVNPFIVRPFYEYEKQFQTLIEQYKQKPVKNKWGKEDPEKSAERLMDRVVIRELDKSIIRHAKESVLLDLPQIAETSMTISWNENEWAIWKIFRTLLANLRADAEVDGYVDQRKLRRDDPRLMIKASRGMIWQDLRRFAIFGRPEIETRLQEYLVSTKPVYEYIRDHYQTLLDDILKLFTITGKDAVRNYPKFDLIHKYLQKDPSSHILAFCNSIKTALELAKLLSTNYEVKVITGKSDQLDAYDDVFEALEQDNSMDITEANEMVAWFWEPYTSLLRLCEMDAAYFSEYNVIANGLPLVKCNIIDLLHFQSLEICFHWEKSLPVSVFDDLKVVLNNIKQYTSVCDFTGGINAGECKIHFSPSFTSKRKRILIATDRLAEGFNLQIAQTLIFVDYPWSIRHYEQRVSRLQRIGSPYLKIYVVALMGKMDQLVFDALKMKYSNVEDLRFIKADPIKISDIWAQMQIDQGIQRTMSSYLN